MADKIVEQPEVATEEVEKDLKEKKTEEVTAVEEKTDAEEEDEEAKENGAEKEPNGKEATNGDSTPAADESDKCIKRKSTGGETEEAKTEEVIPEKKAKLDEEAAPADENGAEVAA